MAIAIGGPKPLTDAVKAEGGLVGPRSRWLGSWCLRSGTADWGPFFQSCKADGVQPLVLAWLWGDDISPAAIRNGVQDRYQNVFKTQANLKPLLQQVMQMAKAAGVSPLVCLENEFNKNGCHASPEFAKWYDDCVAIIRTECPSAKVVFAPGSWGDLTALCAYYKPQVDKSDMVGLQCGYFRPRRTDDLAKVGTAMAANFAKMPAGKPRLLYDCFLSTYGGNFSPTHPFTGGDGKALEAQQAEAIRGLGQIPSLTSIVYRDLRDNPNFDIKNFGGEAEKFVGVARADGTRKPGYAALMALATPAIPSEPKTRTEREYQSAVAQRDSAIVERDACAAMAASLRAERDALKAKVEGARTPVNAAKAILDG